MLLLLGQVTGMGRAAPLCPPRKGVQSFHSPDLQELSHKFALHFSFQNQGCLSSETFSKSQAESPPDKHDKFIQESESLSPGPE